MGEIVDRGGSGKSIEKWGKLYGGKQRWLERITHVVENIERDKCLLKEGKNQGGWGKLNNYRLSTEH